MGIFEKSIPKYVVNPITQDIVIQPEEVYVDDIFDPVFNANVREAMRQKYGDGIYGVLGGYEELLKNAWTGDGGIFGAGMGVLSTFGRSMEKADDLILGGLTEGVKGLTGQGFENPIENIFVEDQDYTGRRLLAAMANSMRHFAGGTTVDESDFGPVWGPASLGIELGTDVGILGSGVARSLAPNASKMTSKELLKDITKADAKTAVGEVAQLMSNYDDLMARVAIDITAPGLRPAFKKLGNKLADYVATHSFAPYMDHTVYKNNPKVRKAARRAASEDPAVAILDDVIATTDTIPETVNTVAKTSEDLAEEVVENEALTYYKFIKDIINSEDYTAIEADVKKYVSEHDTKIDEAYKKSVSEQSEAVGEMLRRMQASGVPIEKIGVDQMDYDALDSYSLDEVRQILRDIVPTVNREYAADILSKVETDEALKEALRTGEFSPNEATNKAALSALGNPAHKASLWYPFANPKYRVSPSRFSKVDAIGELGINIADVRLELARHAFGNPNSPRFSNAEELEAYLKSPRMSFALEEYFPKTRKKRRRWNPNHPKIREAMLDPTVKTPEGYVPILKIKDGEEVVVWRPEYVASEQSLDEIRKAISDVYFPKEGVTPREYIANLEKLSEILDTSKMTKMTKIKDGILKMAPDESYFLEDLFKAFDDSEDFLDGTKYYGINQTLLQRIKDEAPSTLVDDFSNTYDSYVKSALSQAAPYIKTDEDLRYFIEPILKYFQIQPNSVLTNIDNVRKVLANNLGIAEDAVPEHLVIDEVLKGRLTPSKDTLKTVKNFEENVFPKLKAYVDKGGNPLSYRKADKVTWKEHHEVRALLGFTDMSKYAPDGTPLEYPIAATPFVPNPETYANRLMFQELYDADKGTLRVPEWRKYSDFTETDSWTPSSSNLSLDAIRLEDAAVKAKLSQGVFEESKLELKGKLNHIFDKYRKAPTTSKNVSEAVTDIQKALTDATPESVAKEAYEAPSTAADIAEEVVDSVAGDVKRYRLKGGSARSARKIFGKKRWNLFEQIQNAIAVTRKNARREGRATLRTQIATELGKAFTAVTGKARPGDFKRFYKLRSKMVGDTVKGADFWTTFRRSGMLAVPYEKGSGMITATQAALTKNANAINKAVETDVVEVVTYSLDNGNVAVVMRWNGNKQTAKLVKDAQKKLDALKLDDVVFTKASALTTEEQAFLNSPVMRELSNLMDRLQAQAADQAKYLGFQFDSATPYTKHAMRYDPETAAWLNNNFYTRMSSEDYDTVSRLISDFDGYRQQDRGVFGAMLQERRFRGDYWLLDNSLHPLFEYAPDKVFNSTLGDGIFANLQYQTFTDLFVNDNFKIKGWFNSVDDLKEVLYAKTPDGRLSGNLQNLELVSFRTDANGKIIGLTKFDKMSDEGLAKALADENTILVPANVISHMDNLLRKDVRMGNKFWTFVNKHFTIPFKFGLLSNPGFLLGNVGDAYLKLATTMSEKYGTTMTEEAANVAESINTVIRLKNTYSDVFDAWLEAVDEYSIKIAPEARIPEVVAMSPKYKDSLLQFLNGDLKIRRKNPISKKWEDVPVFHSLTKEQVDEARVYMMLQDMQMSSSKLREYSDIADLEHSSDFEVPYNAWDRITQGKGKYNWKKPSTWGLFMNNPVMKSLTDASGSWEELIRTASIVDDLKHKRYTIEQMSEYSKYVDPELGASRRQFDVRLSEAKNTMFNAQFDYERVNDFLSGVGKVVPFPIFFLKNFGYWMELFMRNPQWVDNAIDVQEGLWQGYNEKNDKFMTEAKGRGAIPVGNDSLPEWFKGVYKPSPLQSMFGAFNLLNSPVDNLTYRVNPLISGAATAVGSALPTNDLTTLLMNPESVKYRPYSGNMYERNIKMGDEKFNPVNYTLHRMNPYDRVLNAQMRIPEKVKAGDAQLSDFLPSVFQPIF